MKKYKLFFFIIIIVLLNTKTYPQNIEEKISMLEDYVANLDKVALLFKQKSFNGTIKKGWMLIKKPYNIRIEYENPHPLIIVSNKDYFILYNAEDNLIMHLPISEGPWTIFTKDKLNLSIDKNDKNAHAIIESIEEIVHNGTIHYFYEILIRNENKIFLKNRIVVHATNNPFKINGWIIIDANNNRMHININEIVYKPDELNYTDIFKLFEKDRKSGDVWKGPFNRSPAKRVSSGRF